MWDISLLRSRYIVACLRYDCYGIYMNTIATRGTQNTLRPIGPGYRSRIKASYEGMGGKTGKLTDEGRKLLENAIYQVQNDLECRSPRHEQVGTMNAVRNVLLDDLGENETTGQYSEVARVRAIIEKKGAHKGNLGKHLGRLESLKGVSK